ncbi:MAG: PAS domain-containing protein, partial [Alphaproteobacteria bacterium]|nr:PAS domain-containing protein [Alphaproteobacteria bacterium]
MNSDLATALGQSAPSLDGVPMPVWLYAYGSNRFAWANRAALDFWGVPDLATFRAVDLSDTRSETLERLDRVLERLADGGAVVETWTFYPRGRPATVSCAVWLVEWEGETCLASMALPVVAADAEGELERRDAILETVADGARRLLDGQGW